MQYFSIKLHYTTRTVRDVDRLKEHLASDDSTTITGIAAVRDVIEYLVVMSRLHHHNRLKKVSAKKGCHLVIKCRFCGNVTIAGHLGRLDTTHGR